MPINNKTPKKHYVILRKLLLILVIVVFISNAVCKQVEVLRKAPDTRKDTNFKETLHGVEVVDSYRWLEEQVSTETRDWIDAQNEYAHSLIDPLPGREKLTRRLTELMKIDRIGIPMVRNGRYFLNKRSADQEQWVIYMRNGLDGEDEVLIDPHPMSTDHTTSVRLLDVSKDGTTVVYGIRQGGEDEITVKLLDVDTRTNLMDELPKGRYFGVSITPDKNTLYYSRHAEEGSRVYYHTLGADPASDVEIFGEGYGPDKGIGVGASEDGRHLSIVVFYGSAAQKTEIYCKDLVADGPLIPIVNDIDARFFGDIAEDKFFMQTNWKAPKGRILLVDLKNPAREHWQEIIPKSESVMESFSLAGGKLFVNYLENVVSRVKVFEPSGRQVRDISFPALGTVGGMRGRWESDEAFFVFTSFHVPTTIYRYDVAEGSQEEWARLDVPVKTDIFEVKQVWYQSKDGTKVPMFIVHAKRLKLNGWNPTLLTGYGGFNASLTPYFSATAVLWVESGGVFAMPNLRGGANLARSGTRLAC